MDKFFSLSVLGMLAVGLNGKVCAQADTGVPENERPNIPDDSCLRCMEEY